MQKALIGTATLAVVLALGAFYRTQLNKAETGKEPEANVVAPQEETPEEKLEVKEEEPVLINGKALEVRLDEAYARIHTQGSGQHIRDNFPDIELVYSDDGNGSGFPREIRPFDYWYSAEADSTFNICAVDLTVFVCAGKLDRLIRKEDIDSGRCKSVSIYLQDARLR